MNMKYFNMIIKIAESLEPVSNQRLAAILVYKNEILAVGHNKFKTHPFAKKFSKHSMAIYLHAEVDCIKNALRNYDLETIKKATLYVARVKRPEDNHKIFVQGMAKPCCGCMSAIAHFGIRKVYYTTEDGYDYL